MSLNTSFENFDITLPGIVIPGEVVTFVLGLVSGAAGYRFLTGGQK